MYTSSINYQEVRVRRLTSWAVSDAFWAAVWSLSCRNRQRDPNKPYIRKQGSGRKPLDYRKVFEGIVYVLRTGCQWKAVPPKKDMAVPVPSMPTFACGKRPGYLSPSGVPGWRNTTKWKAYPGHGKVLIAPLTKAPLALEAVGLSPVDGQKKGKQTPSVPWKCHGVLSGHRRGRVLHR